MILVVDDNDEVRAAIGRALGELGYPVHEAADGASALATLVTETPDLVILDYRLTGVDGADIARLIAEREPGLPVISSTGHAALRALRNAAGDEGSVLERPAILDELDTLLGTHLAEGRRRRQAA